MQVQLVRHIALISLHSTSALQGYPKVFSKQKLRHQLIQYTDRQIISQVT